MAKLFAAILIAVLFIKTCDGLRCYQCFQGNNPLMAEHQSSHCREANKNTPTVDCPLNTVACGKSVYRDTVERVCASPCQNGRGKHGEIVSCCYTDLCNHTGNLTPGQFSMSLVLISSLLFRL